MNVNLMTATLRRIYQAPADGEGSDLGGNDGALDIESRIANALSSGNESGDESVVEVDDDGAEKLPEDGDTEVTEEDADSGEDETLAKILGLGDESLAYDDAGNVVFNATINGEQKQVTMQELVKSYQLEGHTNQKSMKLESDRREFEATRDTAYNELANRLNSASNLVKMAETNLLAEFQSIDWDTLRMTDPGEWSALRQHYAERAAQINEAKTQVQSGQQKLTDEQLQEQVRQKQEFLNGEMTKMIADNPAWSDQTVMAKEVGEIGKFLFETYGFKPEEVSNAMDARLMRMIRDAQAFRSGKSALKDKKVPDNIPKFRKGGPNNTNRNDMQKARDAKAVKERIRKSGGSEDAIAAALLNRM